MYRGMTVRTRRQRGPLFRTLWGMRWPCLLATAVAVAAVPPAHAAAIVSLAPSAATIGMVGGTATIELRIDDPGCLDGYNFGLRYNDMGPVLSVSGITIGGTDAGDAGCSAGLNTSTTGKICIAISCGSPIPGSMPPISLVKMTFMASSNGSSNIQFDPTACPSGQEPAGGCFLENDATMPCMAGTTPCTTSNGFIQVGSTPTPTPTNPPTPTPTTSSMPPEPGTPGPIRGNATNPAHDRRGCQLLWRVTDPNNPPDRFQLPSYKQTCVDGDPTCDTDGASGTCTFQVAVCLNNLDGILPACVPNGVTAVTLTAPRPERYQNPALRAVVAQDVTVTNDALQHLLDPGNVNAGYIYAPPLSSSQQNFCSAPFQLTVPVDVSPSKTTRRAISLTTRSSNNSLPRPLVQRSRLKLTCRHVPM